MRFFYIVLLSLIPSFIWSNIDERISSITKTTKSYDALQQLEIIKKEVSIKNNKISLYKVNNAIADCYTDLGLYYKSLTLLKKNLKELQSSKIKYYEIIANTHLLMVNNYEFLFMYEPYLEHTESYYKTISKAHPNLSIYKALYYAYLSRYYNIKNQIDTANYYSSNALNIFHKNKAESNKIPVYKLYGAHLLTIRNTKLPYEERFKYVDTLNYFLEKEIPQQSVKKANQIVSNASLDFDLSFNSFLRTYERNPYLHMKNAFNLYDKASKMLEFLVGPNHNISVRIHGFKLLLYYASGDNVTAVKECNIAIKKITDSEFLSHGFSSNNYFLISLLKSKNKILNIMNSKNDINTQKEIIKNLELLENIWNNYFHDQIYDSSDFMTYMYNESPFSLFYDSYLRLFQITKNKKYLEKIHEYDEKSKYGAILNTSFLTPNEKNEKTQLYNKRQSIYKLYDSYVFLKNKKSKDTSSIRSNLRKLIKEYDLFEKKSDLHKKSKITSLENIQKKLSNNDAVVGFIKNDFLGVTLQAKVITKDTIYIFEIYKDKKKYESIVRELLKEIQYSLHKNDINKFKESSFSLYKTIFKKIHTVLPKEITHLEIIPHSDLSDFPFEMLLYEESTTQDWRKLPYLIKKYDFNQILSSSINNLNSRTSNKNKGTVFFLPNFKDNKLQDLYFSKEKATNLVEKYNATLLSDELASKASFRESLKLKSVITLFSHGQSFKDLNDTNKGIYFTDGFLSLKEIYDLESNCDFLILGACQTGFGGKDNGEGNINLARAFSSIGSKSMLLASWEIDEESTLEITTSFFSYLDQGLTKSEALKKAKLDYIKNTNPRNCSPFYWAGLQIIGSNENVKLNSESNYIKYWVLLLFPILGVGLYFRKKRL
uniref:CHAT domain-containing protein n=1 Tax=Flavobacterium sp. TaxID=239 RepID=UPI00404AAC56